MDPKPSDRDPVERTIAYHQASKHHLDRYAPGPGGLDWANQPDPFRRYAGARHIELPLRAAALATPFESVRRGERPTAYPLERDSLAILFELSLGPFGLEATRWLPLGAALQSIQRQPAPDRGLPDLPGPAWLPASITT